VALTTETKQCKTNPKQCFVSDALTCETKDWITFWDCFGVVSYEQPTSEQHWWWP